MSEIFIMLVLTPAWYTPAPHTHIPKAPNKMYRQTCVRKISQCAFNSARASHAKKIPTNAQRQIANTCGVITPGALRATIWFTVQKKGIAQIMSLASWIWELGISGDSAVDSVCNLCSLCKPCRGHIALNRAKWASGDS